MTHPRAQARRIALQALYQMDVQGDSFIDEMLAGFIDGSSDDLQIRQMAMEMAKSAWAFHGAVDTWIGRIAEKWPVHRMATVDRNILRLAAWEIVNEPKTPPKVVLDEAINMGKEFSTEESGHFINGVLDTLLQEHLKIIREKE